MHKQNNVQRNVLQRRIGRVTSYNAQKNVLQCTEKRLTMYSIKFYNIE